MVELARLESVYTGNRIKGSNPFSSAALTFHHYEQLMQLSAHLSIANQVIYHSSGINIKSLQMIPIEGFLR